MKCETFKQQQEAVLEEKHFEDHNIGIKFQYEYWYSCYMCKCDMVVHVHDSNLRWYVEFVYLISVPPQFKIIENLTWIKAIYIQVNCQPGKHYF